jgi:hypothetical protein
LIPSVTPITELWLELDFERVPLVFPLYQEKQKEISSRQGLVEASDFKQHPRYKTRSWTRKWKEEELDYLPEEGLPEQ